MHTNSIPRTSMRFEPLDLNRGFRMSDYWVWGGSAIKGEDGRYHLFVSRWSKKAGFLQWATHSEVVRASADRPEGPYRFEEVVLRGRGEAFWDGGAIHNPSIHFHDGTYLLFYVATWYRGADRRDDADCGHFSPIWCEAWNHKRTGLATAPSVYGPWTRQDAPVLPPRPGEWDAAIISNPAPWVDADGSVTLVYKSANLPHPRGHYPGRFHLGLARAPHWSAPMERVMPEPVRIDGHPDPHVEDPCIWRREGGWEMLAKDMTGELCGETQGSACFRSEDAKFWRLCDPPLGVSRRVELHPDGCMELTKRERNKVLLEDGNLRCLYSAVLEKDEEGAILDSHLIAVSALS